MSDNHSSFHNVELRSSSNTAGDRTSRGRWDPNLGYYVSDTDDSPKISLPQIPQVNVRDIHVRVWQKVGIALSIAVVAYVILQFSVIMAFTADAVQNPPRFRADYFDYGAQ